MYVAILCEQGDFNSNNKFLHLIGPIIERSNFIIKTRKFSSTFGFCLVGLKVFFSSCFNVDLNVLSSTDQVSKWSNM